jgi:type 1 glutamine amidotransferase
MRDACRLSVTFGTMIRALVSTLVLAAAFALLAAASAHAQATESKVLVYHGASDATTDAGLAALEAIGTADDITVDETELASDLTAENLADYRAVVFLNTPGDRLSVGQEMALEAYVEGGGGFLGIGSAAEVEPGMAFFDALIGARPASPSPTTASDQVVEVGDRVHPATKDLPLEWQRTDIFYQWTTRPTGTVHTLARYRAPDAPAGDGTNTGGTDTPITWCRDLENGRTFYTGLGRTAGSYDNEFKGVLAGGLKWSAGLVRAGCKATIASNYRATRIVSAGPTTTGLATSGESHGLSIAPNGWVFYIGRGDCRTDAERGALIGKASQPRVLDHSDPNVGLGCGSVHVWDPKQFNGTVNSGVTRAATLAVYADGGQGSERTNESQHKMEYGLLGVTVAPDFMQTGHIYLQYFPSFNPQAKPPGLPIERRISKMSRPRISRFTMDLQTKKLDLDSEVVIFNYDLQIWSCCHQGGDMAFDS